MAAPAPGGHPLAPVALRNIEKVCPNTAAMATRTVTTGLLRYLDSTTGIAL